jgi:membrane-associated phospholipid phosphatase
MEEKLLNLINRDWTSPALDGLMAVMSSLNFWAIPLLALAAAIAIFGKFRARAMLIVLALTILISDCLVGNGLKHLIRRPRPNEVVAGVRIVTLSLHHPLPRIIALFTKPRAEAGTEGSAESGWIRTAWSRPDPEHAEGRSFPSDHTLNNFCAAMVLAFFYRRIGWLYFIPAALVGYSRVYVGSHWPSDVAISMVMAIGMSLILLAFYEWLWRKLGPRRAPRLFERHPSLWQSS